MRFRLHHLIVLGLTATLIFPLVGCSALLSLFNNPDYIYEDGAVLVDGGDNPIQAINNPQAVNVSYSEVIAFIRRDLTDQFQYIGRDSNSGQTPFVCSDFAEAVHNNAEAAGIRTGYVSIDWMDDQIGHAVDAFETTDLGIVYIDCTGSSVYSQVESEEILTDVGSWDKVAYIQIGFKYGVIGLDYAKDPSYSYFEQYDQKWQELKSKLADYNAEVRQYNQEIKNRVFREGSVELQMIRTWESELDQKKQELTTLSAEIGDSRFKSLGIVKSVNIHW